MRINLDNFDGEFFATTFWHWFIHSSFAIVLILCLIDIFYVDLTSYTGIRDIVSIAFGIVYFILVFYPGTAYKEKWRNYYMGIFLIVNFFLKHFLA